MINLKNKNILAIDYGTKVVGLAQMQYGREPFPVPFGRIIYKSDRQVCEDLIKIIEDEFIDFLVIGLPLHVDGTETEMSKKVEAFIKRLSDQIKIPIDPINESLSTYEAESRMKNSPAYNYKVDMTRIDEVAACIILEEYIQSKVE